MPILPSKISWYIVIFEASILGLKCLKTYFQNHTSRGVLRKRCSENIQQIYRRTAMPMCDFNKIALQLYWNHTSAWVFFCKFTAYFQNTFSEEHPRTTASLFRRKPLSRWFRCFMYLLLVSFSVLLIEWEEFDRLIISVTSC